MSATMIKEKLGEAQALYGQAKAILTNKEATPEQKASVKGMLSAAQALRQDAEDLKAILDAGIDEALKEASAETLREDKSRQPGASAAAGTEAFGTWGEFLYKVWCAGHNDAAYRGNGPDPRLTSFKDEQPSRMTKGGGPNALKDMVENVGASGGYLVPTEFDMTLRAVMGETAIVRSRATVIPMRRRQLDMPVLNQTGTTAGIPHWFGGLQFYWEEEAGLKTESDASFRKISLVAHKLIGFTRASDELLDDSAIGLDAFLRGPMGFAGGVAWMEDYAFIRGTGAGQPLGVINAPGTINVARAAAGTVGFADIAEMLENFLPSGQGLWLASQSLMSELTQMTGPTGNQSFIWLQAAGGLTVPSAIGRLPGSLMGFPILFTEKAPPRGYDGDLMLIDWRYYLVGDRQATTVESTKFEKWQYDQTSWRVVHRVDGQPWLSAPLTYADGQTQVSPMVVLGGQDIT